MAKQYNFDYIREDCLIWSDYAKRTLTRDRLRMLPLGILLLPTTEMCNGIIGRDRNGDLVEDVEEWLKQRNEYLDLLYVELKNKWHDI